MIPTHLLETFVLFAETGNLVQTAQLLEQTQPSASRQIQQIQNHFKKPLFKMIGRKLHLTSYGKEISSYYRKNILELRDLQTKIKFTEFENEQEILTVAARAEILSMYIANFEFKSGLWMRSLAGSEIRSLMQQQAIDIAVLQENFESLNYVRKKLFTSEWYLVIPSKWATKSTTVSEWFSACSQHPLASYDLSLKLYRQNYNGPMPIAQTPLLAVEDWRIIADKVADQKYWSILPKDFLPSEKVVSLSLTQEMKKTTFYVYYRKELSKNTDLQNLLASLKA